MTRPKALEDNFPRLVSINISLLTERRRVERNSEVAIVPRHLPREQNVFHARTRADVVHDQIMLRRLVPDVCHYTDVVLARAHVPGNKITRMKVIAAICN